MTDTIQSRLLGQKLRSARENAELAREEMATLLGVQPPTVSRWERGSRKISNRDLVRYLQHCNATTEEMDELQLLADDSEVSVWIKFQAHTDQSLIMAAILRAEEQAIRITYLCNGTVPGLLQAPAYSRAIMQTAGVSDDVARQRVAERQGRGQVIRRRDTPVQLIAILDESVIHRQVGGPETFLQQLRYLVECAELPNVTLNIVPFTAGWTQLQRGQFFIIDSADTKSVVHQEIQDASFFFNDAVHVDDVYRHAVEETKGKALSHEDSIRLIVNQIEKLEKE
jgi:transcriptional regulator with XRE-family HTH domain